MKLLPLLALLAAACPAPAVPLARNFSIENYDVLLQPDLAAQRLNGEATIHFQSRIDGLGALELDAGEMEVLSVSDGGAPLYTERRGAILVIVLARPLNTGAKGSVVIRYRASKARGLQFFPTMAYASLFASDWLPSSDRPEDRATLRLRISADPRWKAAASGKMSASTTENGRSVTEWRIETPTSPSLFAFAVGEFAEANGHSGKAALRILAPPGTATAPILDATAAAMQFFAERTGAPYPFDAYTQVFAEGDPQQSAVGMALLPASFPATLAKQPDNLWPLADALAHQWFGVAISYAEWSDFWLGEALSAFLADAFLENHYGKARYQHEIERSRAAFLALQQDGKDRPLAPADWQSPEEVFGPLPIHKGAWMLDQLRRQLTDAVFWRGLRRFTLNSWGKTASADDLQKAMEGASGKKLDKFFERWVTGCCARIPEK